MRILLGVLALSFVFACSLILKPKVMESEIVKSPSYNMEKLPECNYMDALMCKKVLKDGGGFYSLNVMKRGPFYHKRRVFIVNNLKLFVYYINIKDVDFINFHKQFYALGLCRNGSTIYEVSVEEKKIPKTPDTASKL